MTVLGGVPAPAEGMLTKSYKMTVDGANVGFLALLMPSAPPPAGVAPSECAPPPLFPHHLPQETCWGEAGSERVGKSAGDLCLHHSHA